MPACPVKCGYAGRPAAWLREAPLAASPVATGAKSTMTNTMGVSRLEGGRAANDDGNVSTRPRSGNVTFPDEHLYQKVGIKRISLTMRNLRGRKHGVMTERQVRQIHMSGARSGDWKPK